MIFIPTSLDLDNHHCTVTLTSADVGVTRVELSGIGVPPSPFEATRISGQVDRPVTSTLPFRNPSDQMAFISVSLVDIENQVCAASKSVIMGSKTPDRKNFLN